MLLRNSMLVVLMSMPFTPIFAQSMIMGPNPSTNSKFSLYEQAGALAPVREIAVSDVKLPLKILNVKTNYHQIEIDGNLYWMRGKDVRIKRDSNAGCATSSEERLVATIATPGAGKNACK
jgi:hypothetical protein